MRVYIKCQDCAQHNWRNDFNINDIRQVEFTVSEAYWHLAQYREHQMTLEIDNEEDEES